MTCTNQFVQPCDACLELANFDATTVTSQNFLDLIHKRHRNKFNLNLRHDPLVSRLPNEIISLIFIFLDKINVPRSSCSLMRIPWDIQWDHFLWTPTLLSSVCRRWRSIVLTTPQLWTNLLVDVWVQSRKLDLFKEFLSRSGSLPLSLVLCGSKCPLNLSQLEPLVNVIRSHSARWECLNINCAPNGIAHELLHNLDNMPTSDIFHLCIPSFPERITLREPLRPRNIFLRNGAAISKIFSKLVQWDSLTDLRIHHASINTLCNLFKQTPRLTSCFLSDISTSAEVALYPLPQEPINVPSLKRFDVIFQDEESLLLRYLTLPNLIHLDCTFGYEDSSVMPEVPFQDLINFIARSRLDSKALHIFELWYKVCAMNYDPRFFELTNITYLHLSFVIPDLSQEDDIINSYLSRISDISILPHLQIFKVETPTMPQSCWRFICNLFQTGFLPLDNESTSASDSTVTTPQDPSLQGLFHWRPLVWVLVIVDADRYPPIPYQEYLILQAIKETREVEVMLLDNAEADLLEMMAKIYETVPNDLLTTDT